MYYALYKVLLERAREGQETRFEDRFMAEGTVSIDGDIRTRDGYVRDLFMWSPELAHVTIKDG